MQLESVYLNMLAGFRDLNIEFQPNNVPITLILGDQSRQNHNFKNIYQALTWFSARYKNIRTAGVVIADQDILLTRLHTKIQDSGT